MKYTAAVVPTYAGYLVETFVTLVAVCAVAVLVLWGARRVGFARATGPIELRGYLPLDARRAIYLVKVGEQVFVLGVGEGVFTKLGEVADRELPRGDPVREPSAFARVLARTAATARPPARDVPRHAAPQAPPEPARDTKEAVPALPSVHLPVPSLHNPIPSVHRPLPSPPAGRSVMPAARVDRSTEPPAARPDRSTEPPDTLDTPNVAPPSVVVEGPPGDRPPPSLDWPPPPRKGPR